MEDTCNVKHACTPQARGRAHTFCPNVASRAKVTPPHQKPQGAECEWPFRTPSLGLRGANVVLFTQHLGPAAGQGPPISPSSLQKGGDSGHMGSEPAQLLAFLSLSLHPETGLLLASHTSWESQMTQIELLALSLDPVNNTIFPSKAGRNRGGRDGVHQGGSKGSGWVIA